MVIITTRTDKREIEWLEELPSELWLLIAKHLNAAIDILRFRSTCRMWRSFALLPPPPPSFFSPQILIPHNNLTLVQTKLYRLQPIPHHHRHYHPSLTTTITPDSCNKGWIIMVGESRSNPVRLLDPFTNNSITTKSLQKVLNLLNFKFIELTQAYSLSHKSLQHEKLLKRRRRKFSRVPEVRKFSRVPEVQKVVLFPSNYPRMVFALYKDGKLRASKIGDVVMEALMMDSVDNEKNYCFDDIIIHMGQVYVVDKWGTILWVDSSSLKLVQFSPKLCAFGTRKQLVVCGGSFYVVDIYVEGEPENPTGMSYEVVGVKVYRLDDDWGTWVDVKELGDSAFVLGKDTNFSVSAKDYYGCEGNCVYFFSAGKTCAFSLETSKFKDPNIFWPCPSLFHPKFNL